MEDVDPSECTFCRIERDEAPGSFVYEDDAVFAIADRFPVNPGHTLVIPREHGRGLADVTEATGGRVFQVAMQVAAALRSSKLQAEGTNLFLADGEVAFQEVPHLHLHVLPRYPGDGVVLEFDRGTPSRAELDEVAGTLRERIGDG